MVTSPGHESTLADVAINLATVCAEVGQKVAMVSTASFAAPAESDEEPSSPPLWWLNWPSPQGSGVSVEEQRRRLENEDVRAADVDSLMGETGVDGVRRLDLRYFVNHPAQVVIRVPQVVTVLREEFDVVILEVPAYLTVHHGEGLTPIADAVLVVGERNSTTMDDLRKTKSALTRLAAPVVGVVLTGGHHSEEEEEVWGADSQADMIRDSFEDGEVGERERIAGVEDTTPVPIVRVALDNHQVKNGATEHRGTENGSSGHDSADAVLARGDSPEA